MYTAAQKGTENVTIFNAKTGATLNTIYVGGIVEGIVVSGDSMSVTVNKGNRRQLRFFKLPSGNNAGSRDL